MDCASYTAEVDLPGDDSLPCVCGGCDWRGTVAQVLCIDDCSLTPGDPSPAGRCPECRSLAYLDRPEDRLRDAAPHLLVAAKALMKGWDSPSLDDTTPIVERFDALRAAIARAEGRTDG